MYKIGCGETWGGIEGNDVNVTTSAINASLFCRSCDGGDQGGGDIYYFSVCEGDMLTRFALADVAGHGKQVSQTSQWLYDSLRKKMNSLNGPEILEDLNKLAVEYGFDALSTAIVAAFYRADNQFYFTYAGHHPVMVYRREDHEWVAAETPEAEGMVGLPLGVDESTSFQQSKIPLSTGDRIFAYTDGVVEATNDRGELFDQEKLVSLLNGIVEQPLPEIRNTVLNEICSFTDNDLSHDDITFIALEVVDNPEAI